MNCNQKNEELRLMHGMRHRSCLARGDYEVLFIILEMDFVRTLF